MLHVAIVLFALAALGGLYLASRYLRGEVPPIGVALAHGGLAATALILVVISVATQAATGTAYIAALVAFVVAALGGFFLFSRRFTEAKTPVAVIAVHALVAVTGFVVLLVATFT